MTLRARGRVVGGHLRVDIPVDLPDNTEVELAEVAGDDTLSDEDDRELAEILAASDAQIASGEEGIPVEEVIERLRSRGRHEALSDSHPTSR
jgi:hypothetical protein